MAVNREEECLRDSLRQAICLIAVGGKIAVISYQGLEDGIVKDIFRRAAKGCSCELAPDECFCNGRPGVKYLHKGVITPSREEVEANPRARSAKLRVIERI